MKAQSRCFLTAKNGPARGNKSGGEVEMAETQCPTTNHPTNRPDGSLWDFFGVLFQSVTGFTQTGRPNESNKQLNPTGKWGQVRGHSVGAQRDAISNNRFNLFLGFFRYFSVLNVLRPAREPTECYR